MTEPTTATESRAENAPNTAQRVESRLREGLWRENELWLELAELPVDEIDYPRLRQLWLDAPRSFRNRSVPVAVVARAAMLAGEHVEARLLLRKAILSRSQHNRRVTVRLRVKGRLRVELAVPATDGDDARRTASYLSLYNALTVRDWEARDRLVAQLREFGEGEWLERV